MHALFVVFLTRIKGPAQGGRLQAWQTFAAGSFAKIIASVMTYPFQVLRECACEIGERQRRSASARWWR